MQKAVYKIKSVKATALTDFFLNVCPKSKHITQPKAEYHYKNAARFYSAFSFEIKE